MIGPLIKFDHEQSWFVPSANSSKKTSFERQVSIDITQEQYQHLANHVIDGEYRFNRIEFFWEVFYTNFLYTFYVKFM